MFNSLWLSLSFLQLGTSLRDLQFRVFAMLVVLRRLVALLFLINIFR